MLIFYRCEPDDAYKKKAYKKGCTTISLTVIGNGGTILTITVTVFVTVNAPITVPLTVRSLGSPSYWGHLLNHQFPPKTKTKMGKKI